MVTRLANLGYRTARRVVVTLVGGTVLLIGIAMLVLPGPATLVIPFGLAILGLEWAWARRFLRRIKETGGEALQKVGWKSRDRHAHDSTAAPAADPKPAADDPDPRR